MSINNNGGSATVNSDGSITLTPAAGKNVNVAAGALVLNSTSPPASALGFFRLLTTATAGIYVERGDNGGGTVNGAANFVDKLAHIAIIDMFDVSINSFNNGSDAFFANNSGSGACSGGFQNMTVAKGGNADGPGPNAGIGTIGGYAGLYQIGTTANGLMYLLNNDNVAARPKVQFSDNAVDTGNFFVVSNSAGSASNTSRVVEIDNIGTGFALYINNTGATTALRIDQSGADNGINVQKTAGAGGCYIAGVASGQLAYLFNGTQNGNNDAVLITNGGTGNALVVNSNNATPGLGINVLSGAMAHAYATPAFSGAVSIPVTTADVFKITCTSNTASTLTPSAAGTHGQEMTIILTADATGGNVITFAAPFKPAGTLTTTASKGHTIGFVSDGTNWWETHRVLAL